MKKQEIADGKWDYLIILDACRYDYLKETYNKYLQGSLHKRKSRGSNTREWLAKTFPDNYNLTYISANPYINKRGIPLKKMNEYCKYNWTAEDHFDKIIEAWDKVWDKKTGTVLPSDLSKMMLKNTASSQKKIIHYMQPHKPFLTPDLKRRFSKQNDKNRKEKLKRNENFLLKKTRLLTKKFAYSLFNSKELAKIKKNIGVTPGFWEKMYLEGKINKIEEYYKANLKIVLKELKEVIPYLEGKIVVTADHGQAFGEKGMLGHPSNTYIKELTEVPWLVIDNEG